jgi:hypothetical protein
MSAGESPIHGFAYVGIGESIEGLLKFFAYDHLKPEYQIISKPFGELATWIVATLPRSAERTVALRKLLEAKDCAVRASLA